MKYKGQLESSWYNERVPVTKILDMDYQKDPKFLVALEKPETALKGHQIWGTKQVDDF